MNLYEIKYQDSTITYAFGRNEEEALVGDKSFYDKITLLCELKNVRGVEGVEMLCVARYKKLKRLLESMIDYVLDDE